MKILKFIFLMTIITHISAAQNTVKEVDLQKYSGKWHVIASIPTRFDKDWNYCTETYTLNKKGRIDIYTTYIKNGETKQKAVTSKGFPIAKTGNIKWKVQFVWPFRADYLVEELASDYSYVVVGHPKRKYLYIMDRTGRMSNELYLAIVERCRQKGYDMSKLNKLSQ